MREDNSGVDFIVRAGHGIAGTFFGTLPNKSNSRRIFRGISIKSQEALDFVEKVKIVASYSRFGNKLEGATSVRDLRRGVPLLSLKAFVYGDSFQRDLDVELLCDALQHAGVINNDRAIREKHYWWALSDNPRVNFEIGYIR